MIMEELIVLYTEDQSCIYVMRQDSIASWIQE